MKKYITTIILVLSFTGFVTYATIKTKADETTLTALSPKNEDNGEFMIKPISETSLPVKNKTKKSPDNQTESIVDTAIQVSSPSVIEPQKEQILQPNKEDDKTNYSFRYEENEEFDD